MYIPLKPFENPKVFFKSFLKTWPRQLEPALDRLAFDCGGHAQTTETMARIIHMHHADALNFDATAQPGFHSGKY
jgi:hypothetical protein